MNAMTRLLGLLAFILLPWQSASAAQAEPQVGCIAPTVLGIGSLVSAQISAEDCLLPDADHRYDIYELALAAGEKVTLSMGADFPALFGHITDMGATILGPANTYEIAAIEAGVHRFLLMSSGADVVGEYFLTIENAPAVSAPERSALIELYESTNGQNWFNSSNWLGEPGTECSWYGIECNEQGWITGLQLGGNQLNGTLPESLSQLKALRVLNLHDNQLSGSISLEIFKLINLVHVEISNNSLSGSIHPTIGLLRRLGYFGADNNSFGGGIPAQIGELSELRVLGLGGNGLTGALSPELGQLAKLEVLSLWGNQFTGSIPASLGNLAQLRMLSLSGSALTGSIPTELGQLSNLVELWLGGNQLTGSIPATLGNLGNLQILSLEFNQLGGSIPTVLGGLSSLGRLTLNHNLLTGEIPPELTGLTNLTELRLNHNLLTGTVPAGFDSIPNLQTLDVWANIGLQGPLGDDAACEELSALLVDGGAVTGELTPYTDCHHEGWNAMFDFMQLDLEETFIISLQAQSDYYWPHVGVYGQDGVWVAEQQIGENNFLDMELLLPGGSYRPYMSGGSYNHEYNVNVPATGGYSIAAVRRDEPQVGCINPTVVDKGVTASASLNMEDCLTDDEPNRLFDQYTIWLEEGEGVSVNLTADFASQLLHFQGDEFFQATPFTDAGIDQNITVTAQWSGPHRFAVFTTNDTPTHGGSYTLDFAEPAASACDQPLAIALGDTVNGTLNAEVDCFRAPGRLADSFSLELSEMTVFKTTLTSELFQPLLGIYRGPESGLPIIGSGYSTQQTVIVEFILPPGSYRPFATSLSTNPTDPVTGAYSFASQVLAEPNVGCSGATLMTWGSEAQGNISSLDCLGSEERRHDVYSIRMLTGEDVWATVTAESSSIETVANFIGGPGISVGDSGTLAAGQSYTVHYEAPHDGFAQFLIREVNAGGGGSYTLSFSNESPDAVSQHTVLMQIYPATNGESWFNDTGWGGEEGTECSWFGVNCNEDGQIRSLDLQENNLSGTLPDSIGQLSHLENLNLYGNEIGGPIPATLGQLSQLGGLGLYDNNFTGTIPSALGQLSNLNYMDLGGNELTGPIPASFGNLGSLSSLYLYNNMLSGSIPDQLGQLGNLTILNVSDNDLTGWVPQSILDRNLSELSLWGNPLSISTQERAALLALYNAAGGANWIDSAGWLGEPGTECSWPGVVCNAGNVTNLQLALKGLTGTLSSIIDAVGDLSHLIGIDLGGNDISGSIPVSISELTNLRHLYLWGNQLTGTIPAELGNLTGLHGLALGGNQLSGTIPAELGNLTNLRSLHLDSNQLAGSIPVSLGNLSLLEELRLDHNLLTGTIPASLGNIEGLVVLHLHNNLLSGSIPPAVSSLSDLIDYNVWGNLQLDLPLGDAAACDARSPIAIGQSIEGDLQPYVDCHEANAIHDFFELEIVDKTLLRLDVNSEAYWPRVGIIDADSINMVHGQPTGNSNSVETVLMPGTYVVYVTGGTYNHPYNIGVPATGSYDLSMVEIPELQASCGSVSVLTPGSNIAAVLDATDCEDESSLYDSYSVWLNIGQSVTFDISADFESQALSFWNGFSSPNSVSENSPADSPYQMTIISPYSGLHQIHLRASGASSLLGGNYSISVSERITIGNKEACTNPGTISPGDSVEGTLDSEADCFWSQRVSDNFQLSLDAPATIRATFTSDDFMPLLGMYTAAGEAVALTASDSPFTPEFVVSAGEYELLASSYSTSPHSFDTGSYTLELGQPSAEPQIGCTVRTFLIGDVAVSGMVTESDCVDPFLPDAGTVSRNYDWYAVRLPSVDSTAYLTVAPEFDYTILHIYNGALKEAYSASASQMQVIELAQNGEHSIRLIRMDSQQSGNYDLELSVSPPPLAQLQYAALTALYHATGGDNWNNRSGWIGAEDTVCSWYGVSCNVAGEVTAIRLQDNGLDGSIPPMLGYLTSLELLDLRGNAISGTVPDVFEDFTVIQTGELPARQVVSVGAGRGEYVQLNSLNTLPFLYDATDGDATLTGLGVRIHFNSADVDSLSIANILQQDLTAVEQNAQQDTGNHDNDSSTDSYLSVAWASVSGSWPGVLPVKLFDLELQLSDSVEVGQPINLNLSRISNASGYPLVLPALTMEASNDNLDVDGNGVVDPLTDGLLIVRSLFGFQGNSLIAQAIGQGATHVDATAISARLLELVPILDVDGNEEWDALTDGLLAIRYLFGFRGTTLISNAIGAGAQRSSAAEIETYLSAFVNQ